VPSRSLAALVAAGLVLTASGVAYAETHSAPPSAPKVSTLTAAHPSAAAEALAPGDVAVTVSVTQAHGVAGLIAPGDKVDVLADIGAQESYLYQGVPVLAVGTTLATSTATTLPGAQATFLVTLAVPPAARAVLADSTSGGVNGGVYLALDANGNAPVSGTTITGSNLIPGMTTQPPATVGGTTPAPAAPTGGGTYEPTP